MQKYIESSTGDNFRDSTAYITEKLWAWEPPIHLYKIWKDHISQEILQTYHSLHHLLSQDPIPLLDISWQYDASPIFREDHDIYHDEPLNFSKIQIHILDLDPNYIGQASHIETKTTWLVTNPLYVEWDYLWYIKDKNKIIPIIFDHLESFCISHNVEISKKFDIENFLVTKITDDGVLHITCTDLWSDVVSFVKLNENFHKENII